MTVAELIAKLQEYHPDARVVVDANDVGYEDIEADMICQVNIFENTTRKYYYATYLCESDRESGAKDPDLETAVVLPRTFI